MMTSCKVGYQCTSNNVITSFSWCFVAAATIKGTLKNAYGLQKLDFGDYEIHNT